MCLKRILRGFLASACIALVAACETVPEESVTLSEDVGAVLEDLRSKNAAVVGQLFSDRAAAVNSFVDEVYAPEIVADTLTRLNFIERLQQRLNLNCSVVPQPSECALTPLRMMQIVVNKSIERIEKTRSELLGPIERQEREVQQAFADAFGIAIRGNETTTGLLKSIRDVQLAQEDILNKVGIRNLRDSVNEKVAGASDTVLELIGKARSGEKSLDKLEETIGKIKEALGSATE